METVTLLLFLGVLLACVALKLELLLALAAGFRPVKSCKCPGRAFKPSGTC